jgi:hypothetical protein
MPKIIRAYAVTRETPSLLQTIEEAGFLDKVKGAIKGAVAGAKKGAADADNPEAALPDRTRQSSDLEDTKAITKIVSELFSDASSDNRLVVFLSLGNLKSMYLQPGGGQKVIDDMDQSEISSLITDIYSPTARMKRVKPGFKFKDLITPPAGAKSPEEAVQIDVPTSLFDELEGAADVEAAKQTLKKMMSHKYYVGVLNVARSKKIASAVDKGKDTESRAAVFDPAVLQAWPNRQTLDAAKQQWYDEKGEGKEDADTQSLMRQAQRQQTKDEAGKILSGDREKIKQNMLNIVMNANDGTSAANTIHGQYKDSLTNQEMAAMLMDLHAKLGSPKVKDAADALSGPAP